MVKRSEMLKRVRERVLAQKSGGGRDPNEWRPEIPRTSGDPTNKYKFFVLPGVEHDDRCATGKTSHPMEDFFVPYGVHWVNRRPHTCPRIIDGESCPLCTHGFDLMNNTREAGGDKDMLRNIAKLWLPNQRYIVNIYFPNIKSNPEELRGEVRYWMAPRVIFGKWETCILNEDVGDEDDPQAYGLFYWYDDGKDDFTIPGGFLFQLCAGRQHEYPTYEGSKFLYGKGSIPLISTKSGKPDFDRIQDAMDQRHDLWSKIDPRNIKELKDQVAKIAGESQLDEFEEEEEEEIATPRTRKGSVEAQARAKVRARQESPETTTSVVEEEEEEEDEQLLNLIQAIKNPD